MNINLCMVFVNKSEFSFYFCNVNLCKTNQKKRLVLKRLFAIILIMYSLPVCSYLMSAIDDVAVQKVIIDPGHGGRDPGNLGTGRYATQEKDIALAVSLQVGKYIEDNIPDVEVIYTRTSDKFPELYERTALANNEKADLFISIHCDAFTSSQANGCSSFVVGMNHGKHSRIAIKENPVIETEQDRLNYGNFDIHSPEYQIEVSLYQKMFERNSLSLAEKIQTQFRERVNRRDRGVKREPLYVTSRVAMPSVLVELGFLTNPQEEDFLNSEQGQTYMASAIYRAFKAYKEEQEGVVKDVKDLSVLLENSNENIEEVESDKGPLETYLSVQLFSSKSAIKPEQLIGVPSPIVIERNDVYRCFSGQFINMEDVNFYKNELIKQGFKDCFIVGIHKEERLELSKVIELLK